MRLRDLKPHEYNNVVFRKIVGDEFEVFKESIKQQGLQIKIEITSDNIILCGHQRIRALKEIYGEDYNLDNSKIWVREDLESDDEAMTNILQKERVIEDNQLRRHLNEGEMTMIYMEKKKLEKIKGELRRLSTLKKGNVKPEVEDFPQREKGKARDHAAEGMKITGRTLENYEKMYHLADKKEKEHLLKTGKILPSLKKRYTLEKQRLALQKKKEANELRKKKAADAKKKKEKARVKKEKERLKQEKQKKKELEDKIKREKLAKEEAESLRKEQEEEKLRLEEEEKLRLEEEERKAKEFIVYYKSSEKMEELDETIGLVVTSPPYWQIKDYGSREDKRTYQDYLKSMKKVWKECFRVLKPSSKLCINIGDQTMSVEQNGKFEVMPIHAEFIKQCKEIGFDYHGSVIWQKVSTVNSSGGSKFMGSYPNPKNGLILFDYEFILVFHKPGDSQKVSDDIKKSSSMTNEEWQKYFSSHWNFVGEKQKEHPAVFPEELPRRLIKMFSFKEEIVLDPFLGSGTTLKVSKELERRGIGYELNEDYKPLIEDKMK